MQLTFTSLSPDDLRQVIREEVAKVVHQASSTVPEQPAYLTLGQAAELYGVSKSYLYRLSSERAVSTRKVGKSVQFHAKELEAFFNEQTKKSLAVIDAEQARNGVFPTLKGKRRA